MFGSRGINDKRWLFWSKSLKIGQLQMSVESREPIMHLGFFSFKTFTYYRRTQKTPYRRFPMAAILSKISQVIMTTWPHGMLLPEGSKLKKNFIPK
jgi:hypothetical protein